MTPLREGGLGPGDEALGPLQAVALGRGACAAGVGGVLVHDGQGPGGEGGRVQVACKTGFGAGPVFNELLCDRHGHEDLAAVRCRVTIPGGPACMHTVCEAVASVVGSPACKPACSMVGVSILRAGDVPDESLAENTVCSTQQTSGTVSPI